MCEGMARSVGICLRREFYRLELSLSIGSQGERWLRSIISLSHVVEISDAKKNEKYRKTVWTVEIQVTDVKQAKGNFS